MVQEPRRLRAADESRQAELASGGVEDVLAADDEVDALFVVVHDDGELIRPVAVTVADEHVAALRVGVLRLRTEAKVGEVLGADG